jgi:putative membrane protein
MNKNIFFLGCGKMGGIIAQNLRQNQSFSSCNFLVLKPSESNKISNINYINDLVKLPQNYVADIVFICIKPQESQTILEEFAKAKIFHQDTIFISILATIIISLLHLLTKTHQDLLSSYTKELTAIYSLIGFVMSLLLLFRTNGAYDRWWEGRKLWGAIVNDCRSAFLKISCRISSEEDKKELAELFRHYIHNAKNNLRANKKNLVFNRYEDSSKDNSPVQVMKLIYSKLIIFSF